MRLAVVAFALPFWTEAVPFYQIAEHWPIIVNLLAGSLAGAWLGAGWVTRLKSGSLCKVIAVMPLAIAVILLLGHSVRAGRSSALGLVDSFWALCRLLCWCRVSR